MEYSPKTALQVGFTYMSQKTLKYFSANGNGITFADVAHPVNTLRFSGSNANIPGSVNGRRVSAVRNNINMLRPTQVLPSGCTDTCSALTAVLSGSVSFSGPAESAAELKELWTDLKTAVDAAIESDSIFLGFKPSANREFILGEA